MDSIQNCWNASSATIPHDKEPSAYAIEKERLFPRNAHVCDLGGGSGVDSLFFAALGHDVVLVDVSDVALTRAVSMAADNQMSQRISVVRCNMGEGALPLPSAAYDVVYSRLALHYFEPESTSKLFAEVHRILKLGGHAYLTLKSPDDAAEMRYLEETAIAKYDGVFDDDGHIKSRYSSVQLSDLLEKAGIEISEFQIKAYKENLSSRKDLIKSGNKQLLMNEILVFKAIQ